jgi:hypothetical protein
MHQGLIELLIELLAQIEIWGTISGRYMGEWKIIMADRIFYPITL